MKRVLIVDDQPAFRTRLREMLTRAGLEVVAEAGGIPEAEAALTTVEADLGVVDVMMPGINGLEGTARLKKLKPELRIILISALADHPADLRAAALRAGAESFVAKDDLVLDRLRTWADAPAGPAPAAGCGGKETTS